MIDDFIVVIGATGLVITFAGGFAVGWIAKWIHGIDLNRDLNRS
jgi:hypothetical protein